MRKTRWWIVLVFTLIVCAGLVWWFQGRGEAAPSESELGDSTVLLSRGSLELVVTATGSVALAQEISLSSKISGRVASIPVREGQRVDQGQVLLTLETQELEESLLQALAGQASAEASLSKALAGSRVEEIAAAEAVVAMAQAGIEAALAGQAVAESQVRAAQAALETVEVALAKLVAGPTELDIAIAEKQIELARNQLWGLQGQRDALAGPTVSGSQRESAEGQVAAGESQVAIAELQLAQLKAGPGQHDIDAAKAQVSQAEAGVETALAQVLQAEAQVANARAQLQQSQAQLGLLKSGVRPQDISAAEAQVAQAQALVAQAELARDSAQLVAPFSGLIATIVPHVGELVAAGQPAMVIVDDSSHHIMIYVDEVDIGQISLDQTVDITLDAFPGQDLSGLVEFVAPVPTLDGGIVSYRVRLAIVSAPMILRSGLTANATIVTRSIQDALLVPNSAISVEGDRKFVARMVGQDTEIVEIETGLQTSLQSEVTVGLNEGDRVLVQSTSYRDQFAEMMQSTFKQR